MTPALAAEQLRGTAFTTIITASFAMVWGLSGSFAFGGLARVVLALVVILVSVAWFAAAHLFHRAAHHVSTLANAPASPFSARMYWFAVIAQFVAIPIAARLLSAVGYPDAIISAVAAIVGLHFFGLIPVFHSWRFAVVGGAMVLLALASLAFAPFAVGASGAEFKPRTAVVGLGSMVILWMGIAPLVMAARKAVRLAAQAP